MNTDVFTRLKNNTTVHEDDVHLYIYNQLYIKAIFIWYISKNGYF